MNYWLVKTEPSTYSWQDLLTEGQTPWDGVRNYQARNNLKLMQPGDKVLFYHSVTEKQIVGLAEVVSHYYPDPTTTEPDKWVAVDIKPVVLLNNPVTLKQLKEDGRFSELKLITHSRLSVMPVEQQDFEAILSLGGI